MDVDFPNSFAVSNSSGNSSIYLTKGLIRILNRNELQGVIAHEISHIVNKDTDYILHSGLYLLSYASLFKLKYFSIFGCMAFLLGVTFALFFGTLTIFSISLFYCALSRNREYLADASAVRYTRYPLGLASALKKISNYYNQENNDCDLEEYFKKNFNSYYKPLQEKMDKILPVRTNPNDEADAIIFIVTELFACFMPAAFNTISDIPVNYVYNKFLSALYIVPTEKMYESSPILSTHPLTKYRTEILLKMQGAGYKDYNSAFTIVTGKKGIINSYDVNSTMNVEMREDANEVLPDDIVNKIMNIPAAAAVIAGEASFEQEKQFKKDVASICLDETIDKKVYANNLVKKLANYTFIECACLTTLKIPECYAKTEIICPHCKTKHLIT